MTNILKSNFKKAEELMNKCDICSNPASELEPRFLYWTCSEHRNIPPAYRQQYKRDNFKDSISDTKTSKNQTT